MAHVIELTDDEGNYIAESCYYEIKKWRDNGDERLKEAIDRCKAIMEKLGYETKEL